MTNPSSQIRTFPTRHGKREFRLQHQLDKRHLTEVIELYDREWPSRSRSNLDFVRAFQNSELVLVVIDVSTGQLVGFCRCLSDRGMRAWISGLIVRDEYRGLGIARWILDSLLQAQELQGVHAIGLSCAPGLVDFYRQWNFEVRQDEMVMNLIPRELRLK